NVAHAGGGQLVCVARLVNDDHNPLMAAPKERYHDLSYAIPGTGIHPGTLPADAYYEPGPPSAPLIISFSSDTGKTWTPAKPMDQARGCFPRMALGDGVLALTYGGLAYPRWGNCVTFSTDAGKTWSDEVLFAPFFTTGYTDIIATGAKEFVAVFDCTPPQPWKDHAAHWVGAVDIEIV
ncbi:MAG TPA: sialidase family protein, partial [Candidatus Hydrogenedentes bacterium]|nr:sialidase family protein [Candidatus Hydrogenedentota bacterium]